MTRAGLKLDSRMLCDYDFSSAVFFRACMGVISFLLFCSEMGFEIHPFLKRFRLIDEAFTRVMFEKLGLSRCCNFLLFST